MQTEAEMNNLVKLDAMEEAFYKELEASDGLSSIYERYILPSQLRTAYKFRLIRMSLIMRQPDGNMPNQATLLEFILWLIEKGGSQIVHVMPCIEELGFDYTSLIKIYDTLRDDKPFDSPDSTLTKINFSMYLPDYMHMHKQWSNAYVVNNTFLSDEVMSRMPLPHRLGATLSTQKDVVSIKKQAGLNVTAVEEAEMVREEELDYLLADLVSNEHKENEEQSISSLFNAKKTITHNHLLLSEQQQSK